MTTILLLTISNIFMPFAWYGHPKYRNVHLFKVILVSWIIAFAEYCFVSRCGRIELARTNLPPHSLYSVARDYMFHKIRCNCISPARVHTPFVDDFLRTNYPGREKEMFDKLSEAQPIGRMAQAEEVALLPAQTILWTAGSLT